ncbi:MAG: cell surface receptor domain protein [Myxococcales bacterium]|nr:cell surface receptor domain protein [Myxococcales bacterium]
MIVVVACGNSNHGTPDAALIRPDTGPALPQCSDGKDNDGDGKIDYPNDPGCSVPNADDESDDCPDGAHCPQCGNGMDDDMNGLMDYPNDPSCSSAADDQEYMHNPVACGAGLTIKDVPVTGFDAVTLDMASQSAVMSSCGGGNNSLAYAYELHIPHPTVLVATTDDPLTTADTVLDLRTSMCSDPGSEIVCNNDISTTNKHSTINQLVAPGIYYLIVEGANSSVSGMYTLHVSFFLPQGSTCTDTSECGPGLVCRVPLGQTGMVCTKPMCNDGVDDDGDGKNDYPDDPGCTSPSDNDETDDCPSGPNCPQCGNGIDDDGDTHIDYPADPTCLSASGTTEACPSHEPVAIITTPMTSGDTSLATDDSKPACALSTAHAPDLMYRLDLPATTVLRLNLTTPTFWDTVTALYNSTCGGTAVSCSDPLNMTVNNLAAGTYYFLVDGWNNGSGAFTINVSGNIANGQSCESALAQSGALTCGAGYACNGTMGSRTCTPAACHDGIDNDGDGKTDFPLDPGCTNISDNDETDGCPSGPTCPQCSNGIDDDGDGRIDYPTDTTCTSAAGTSEACVTSEPIMTITTAMTMGDTTNATNDVRPSCSSTFATAPDLTYRLDLPKMSSLSLNLTTPTFWDTVSALYNSTCGPASLVCSDPLNLSASNLAAGTYYFVVDGWSSGRGPFTINTSGVIAFDGSCEGPLAQAGAFTCAAGSTCSGTPGSRTCVRPQCSDGVDNDADGKVDYPNDPGCTSLMDNDETDDCPSGPNCPQCGNGIDDDANGRIDYPVDTNCTSASGPVERVCPTEQDMFVPITTGTTMDTLVGAHDDHNPSCGADGGPDRLYSLTIPALKTLRLDTNNTSFDTLLSLMTAACNEPSLQCDDNSGATPGASKIVQTNVAAGTYVVAVDAASSTTVLGNYNLHVSGVLTNGASCEPADTLNGALVCDVLAPCSGTVGSMHCTLPACSDGIDNDLDGLTDYPNDPGCESVLDNDETDSCPGAGCPACSNTMDDDADMKTDYAADPSCWAASGTDEAFCPPETNRTLLIMNPQTSGTTVGATNDFVHQSCQFSTNNDVTLALVLPVPVATLTIDTKGSTTIADTVLSLRDETCGNQLACDDDGGNNSMSLITVNGISAGTYSVIVDGYGTHAGAFVVNVLGTVAPGTACTSPLFTTGVLVCPTGTSCTAGMCQ